VEELGGTAISVTADVTDAKALEEVAKAAILFGGKIDVWINNAGVLAAGEFTETPIEVHDRVIEINLIGYLHGAYAVLPYFKQQGYVTL
jgi:short-subunit dehydrogenase